MLHRLNWQPGFNSQQTQTTNSAGWFSGNLVRWRYGLLEKVGGWEQLFAMALGGIARALHGYLDLSGASDLLIGEDTGAQLYRAGVLQNLTFLTQTAYFNSIVYDTTNTNPAIVTTNTSTTATVTWDAHGGTTGQTLTLLNEYSIGGMIIPAGFTASITVTGADTFTFTLPQAAVNNTLTGVIPTIGIAPPTPAVNRMFIQLNNHGLSAGQEFTFAVSTTFVGEAGTTFGAPFGTGTNLLLIPAGAQVKVLSPTTNQFFFSQSQQGSGVWAATPTVGSSTNLLTGSSVQPVVMTIAGSGPNVQPVTTGLLWSIDNLGNNGVLNYANGPVWIYTPGSLYLANSGATNASPQINTGLFAAMPQAQIIAFGSEVIFGGGVQDTLLLRWTDAGSYSDWTATATNQAGSYHLGGTGSQIVGGIQAPQTTLIWTDVEIWSMAYVGAPFIYSFTTLGTGCGLIAQNARAILGRTCLWATPTGFYTFSDSGIAPVECPVWDILYTDLDPVNQYKMAFGASTGTNEIWIFYPSVQDGLGENSRYLKYNVLDNLWDFGELERSAWYGESLFGQPLGTDLSLIVQQHETGYDANGTAMAGVYAETGFADINAGDAIMYVDEYIQDMKWFGLEGAAAVTLYGVNYPGDNPTIKGPYGLDSTNRYIRPQLRARQIALRIDWAARLGFSARLGTPRIRAIPAGTRP